MVGRARLVPGAIVTGDDSLHGYGKLQLENLNYYYLG